MPSILLSQWNVRKALLWGWVGGGGKVSILTMDPGQRDKDRDSHIQLRNLSDGKPEGFQPIDARCGIIMLKIVAEL